MSEIIHLGKTFNEVRMLHAKLNFTYFISNFFSEYKVTPIQEIVMCVLTKEKPMHQVETKGMEETEKSDDTKIFLTPEQAKLLRKASMKARKSWMRNRLCQCGSGKKFKKCCWSKAATLFVPTKHTKTEIDR